MTRTILITFLTAMLLSGRLSHASEQTLFAGPYILGSSVYSARDFASYIAPHVGQPMSAALLGSLSDAIRLRYARDGYITPIVSIPRQDAESSNPRLVIHEALITDIEIRGKPGPYRHRIEKLARELQQSHPLRKDQLRSVLARVRQLPGISSKPILDPRPDSTNEFLLVLQVQYQPVSGGVEISNGGTKGLGRELLSAALATNDALGLQEQMRFSAATSSHPDRYQYEDARIQRSFSSVTLFADISGSKALPDPHTYFRNVHFSTGLTQQWQLSANRVLSLGASVNGDNGSVRDATNSSIEDHERNVALGLTVARIDEVQPARVFLGVQRGVDVAGGAVNEGTSSQVDTNYLTYLLAVQQVVSLGRAWSFQIDLNGQMTSSVLPVLDRFAFGGIGFGAAFDPGSLSGDSGAELSAQLVRVIHLRHWGLQYVRVYLRCDTGIMWNNAPYFYHREEATSAGGGVFARWRHIQSTVELSAPVDQPSYLSSQSLRSFGSVEYVF